MHVENLLVKWRRDGGRRRHTAARPVPRRYEGPSGGDTLCPPAHGTQEAGAGCHRSRRVSVAMAISGDAANASLPGLACVCFHRSMHSIRTNGREHATSGNKDSTFPFAPLGPALSQPLRRFQGHVRLKSGEICRFRSNAAICTAALTTCYGSPSSFLPDIARSLPLVLHEESSTGRRRAAIIRWEVSGNGEMFCHLHEIDAGGMLRGWGSHEHTHVVGDAADLHQHARDRLPEALQDGVCKAGAPADRCWKTSGGPSPSIW